MKSKIVVLSLLVILFLNSCINLKIGHIQGIVKDSDTKAPLANASVSLNNNKTTFTNSLGFYNFSDLPLDVYSITVTLPDYVDYTKDVALINKDEIVTTDILLVHKAYVAPTASFIVNPLNDYVNKPFSVDASGSTDALNQTSDLQVRWRWDDNSAFSEWSTVKTATHLYSTNGVKNITLEVKNTFDKVGTISKTVTVTAISAPLANFSFSPSTGYVSQIFSFDASASSDILDNVSVLQVRWMWENGSTFSDWTTLKTATHQYTTSGVKNITLEVKNTFGEIGTLSKMITVNAVPAPVANFSFSPSTGYVSQLFSFDASASSDILDNANVLQVRWMWENGSTFSDWSTIKTATHQYTTSGVKNITLEVKNTNNVTTQLQKNITVLANLSPLAKFTTTPQLALINSNFNVDASQTTDDQTPTNDIQVQWTWESNGTPTTWTTVKTATHSYSTSGYKIITLSAKDAEGVIGYKTDTVEVAEMENVEPSNNIYSSAQQISVTSIISGDIGFDVDNVDWFKLTMPSNGQLVVSLDNIGNNNIGEVIIYDNALNQLSTIGTGGFISGGTTMQNSAIGVYSGAIYYIKVNQYLSENSFYKLSMKLSAKK